MNDFGVQRNCRTTCGLQAGLDSLGAVELRNTLTSHFSIDLPPTLAFDYPTESALLQFVVGKLQSSRPEVSVTQRQRLADQRLLSQTSEILSMAYRYPNDATGKLLNSCILCKPMKSIRLS